MRDEEGGEALHVGEVSDGLDEVFADVEGVKVGLAV